MRIAFIGQKGVLPAKRAGGIEKRVFEIGRRLVNLGHHVTVYARRQHMPGIPKYVEGMRMFYLPTIYSKNVEAILHTFLATIHAVWADYDIYHYHGVGPSTLAWIPRLLRPKRRVIVTFHARDQFHQKWSWIGRTYLRFGEWTSVKFPHFCISVSHLLQVVCREIYGVQSVYIPNGATPQFVQESDVIEEFGLRPKKYFLSVGRLLPVKGFHHLIKAFREVETDFELVIVGDGDGDYARELHDLADGDPRIRFLGFQSDRKLEQLYAHAYAYIQPSESEGLPLSVLEAMSYGVAPVVSDIEGNLEAIYRTGFVFENANPEALRDTLQRILRDQRLVVEQGEEARAVVETKFSWDVIAQHEENLYVTSYH